MLGYMLPESGKKKKSDHLQALLLSLFAYTVYFPGSQATVVTKTVAVGDTTSNVFGFLHSTPLKRKAPPPDDPQRKCPVLELSSFQECDISSSFADPDDSTFLPSMSDCADTTCEQ